VDVIGTMQTRRQSVLFDEFGALRSEDGGGELPGRRLRATRSQW
jgi:hypothetical protein